VLKTGGRRGTVEGHDVHVCAADHPGRRVEKVRVKETSDAVRDAVARILCYLAL